MSARSSGKVVVQLRRPLGLRCLSGSRPRWIGPAKGGRSPLVAVPTISLSASRDGLRCSRGRRGQSRDESPMVKGAHHWPLALPKRHRRCCLPTGVVSWRKLDLFFSTPDARAHPHATADTSRSCRHPRVEKYRPTSLDGLMSHQDIIATSTRPRSTVVTHACRSSRADSTRLFLARPHSRLTRFRGCSSTIHRPRPVSPLAAVWTSRNRQNFHHQSLRPNDVRVPDAVHGFGVERLRRPRY